MQLLQAEVILTILSLLLGRALRKTSTTVKLVLIFNTYHLIILSFNILKLNFLIKLYY